MPLASTGPTASVVGVLHTSAAVAPGMKRAGEGKIVNISSGAGLRPSLTSIQGYTTAKHAQIGLTKQLALELGPAGINVNSVAPGFIRSNPSTESQWAAYTPQKQASIRDGRFIQRDGHPNDIERHRALRGLPVLTLLQSAPLLHPPAVSELRAL